MIVLWIPLVPEYLNIWSLLEIVREVKIWRKGINSCKDPPSDYSMSTKNILVCNILLQSLVINQNNYINKFLNKLMNNSLYRIVLKRLCNLKIKFKNITKVISIRS